MQVWEAELGGIVARRSGALIGYAYVLCGDRTEAEDLVQEALVRVFSRWRRARPTRHGAPDGTVGVDTDAQRSTEAYVRATILNLYLDGYRRRRHLAGIEHRLEAPRTARGPESGVTARADVVAALGRLTPTQRACVVLRYFEDLTVPQVAARMGVADGTVKRRLFEALRVLRSVLDDLGPLPDDVVAVRDHATLSTPTEAAR